MAYVWWADRFGFTYDQVQELPMWLRHRMPACAGIMDEVRAEKRREAQKG